MNKNASGTKVKYIKEESYEALATPLPDTRNKNLQDAMAGDTQSNSMFFTQSSHLLHHFRGFLKKGAQRSTSHHTMNAMLQFNTMSVGIHCPWSDPVPFLNWCLV